MLERVSMNKRSSDINVKGTPTNTLGTQAWRLDMKTRCQIIAATG